MEDFEVGIDRIGLDAASFGLSAGALAANRFYAFGAPITATDFLVI